MSETKMEIVLDLSWKGYDVLPECKQLDPILLRCNTATQLSNGTSDCNCIKSAKQEEIHSIEASHNFFKAIPGNFLKNFSALQVLNVSNNCLTLLPDEICTVSSLKEVYAKNNRFTSLPKHIHRLNLEVLNISGNSFKIFPHMLCQMKSLKDLHMGGNQLREIPTCVQELEALELFYLGGNMIRFIPNEVGNMTSLKSLALCDNQLRSIPSTLSKLHNLQSLSLHNNDLCYLPREVLSLFSLMELSLRGNPLVARFVRDLTYDPPTLLELASRTIATCNVKYSKECLPSYLVRHLNSASKCPNPKCTGLYFEHRYKQIKFVDFCGKYRLPLMQYLCSPGCMSPGSSATSSEYETEDEEEIQNNIMRRVLLG